MSISPATSRVANHAVMRELVNKHPEVGFQVDCFAYDGSKILYTLGELKFETSAFEITLQDEEDSPADGPKALQRYTTLEILPSMIW